MFKAQRDMLWQYMVSCRDNEVNLNTLGWRVKIRTCTLFVYFEHDSGARI